MILELKSALIQSTSGVKDEVKLRRFIRTWNPSGLVDASNLFELPDPFGDEARYEGTPFDGAYHYLKIHYADGGVDAALVALPLELKGAWLGETGCEWDPTASWPDPACKWERVAWFSVNVDAYRQPRKVELYRANGRYPNINADDPRNELLHERLIDPVDVPSLPPMHRVGGAQIDSEAGVNVDRVCDGPALRPEELPGLSVSVSVLSPMEPFPVASEAELLAKVRPGVDGLMLTEGPRRGLFLPAVWEEVPDPATFLAHLRRKAGLPAGWWSPSLQVHRFTVRKIAGPPPAGWPAP